MIVTGSFELEPLCGRPKAMKFDSEGNLVLVDSHKGLLKVHIANGEVETLVSSEYGEMTHLKLDFLCSIGRQLTLIPYSLFSRINIIVMDQNIVKHP